MSFQAKRLGQTFMDLIVKHIGDEEDEDQEIRGQDMVEKLMNDTTKADTQSLPNTGCDPDWELNLSSIFVEVDTKSVSAIWCLSLNWTYN